MSDAINASIWDAEAMGVRIHGDSAKVIFVRAAVILGQNIFYLQPRVRPLRAGSAVQLKVVNATAHGACHRKTRLNSNSFMNMTSEMVPSLQVPFSLSVSPNKAVDSDAARSSIFRDAYLMWRTSLLRSKKMKLIILLFLLLPLVACAADSTSVCSAADSHAGQRACLISMSAKVGAQLARVEVESLERIDHWDEDASYRAKSKKALVNSNAAFRKYRTSQCGLVHSLAAGGNGATDMQLECSIELAKQRISQLETSVLRLERH